MFQIHTRAQTEKKTTWSRVDTGNFIDSYRFVLHNLNDDGLVDTYYVVSCGVFICKSPSIYSGFLKHL